MRDRLAQPLPDRDDAPFVSRPRFPHGLTHSNDQVGVATPGHPRPANVRPNGDLGHFPDGRLPRLIHSVFVGDEVLLDVSFAAARVRLASLIGAGLVDRASAQAYSGEITGLARVGPLGPLPGLSRVVKVRVEDLKAIGDSARFALRWEVAGSGGVLFPALDADITLVPAGEHSTTLTLAGVYRPPLGAAGAALDRTVMHRVATATIGAFLAHIADAIAHPASATEALDSEPPPLSAGGTCRSGHCPA